MKNKMKGFIALLLAFAMVFTQLPTTAFAETNEGIINWKALEGQAGGNSSILPDTVNDAVTSGNRIVTAGVLDEKGITVDGGKGDRDATLKMYNSDGSILWETITGGSKQDYYTAVTEGPNGNFVAVGASKSADGDFAVKNTKNYDGIIAIHDDNGKLIKSASFGGTEKEEFNALTHTYDGGYVAAGYSYSVDGDMEKAAIEGCPRTAILVKFDKDLNLQWTKAVGGASDVSSYKIINEFESVILDPDGGFVAVGTSSTVPAEKSELNNTSKNGLIAKISDDGNLEWTKIYGGTSDDEILDIAGTHLFTKGETVKGYVITGTTESNDFDFTGNNQSNLETAFVMGIDQKGNIQWKNTLQNSASATGKSVHTIEDGFLVTGEYEAADGDFAGVTSYGKEDIYVAHYSLDGYFREMHSVGASDKDLVSGISRGPNDNYLIYGTTKSKEGIFDKVQGPADGFIMNLNKDAVEKYATEKYLVPVKAMHLTEDKPSMMAPLLYKDAYVEKTGELYTVTIYFTNAELMGSQVNSSTLGALSYEYKGKMRPALYDEYNATKQVKTSKITSLDLSKMTKIHIEDTMGDIRLKFNPENKVETEVPPHFPDIEVSQPDFEVDHKFTTGGTDYDYTYDMTVLENGNLAIVGQTFSYDMDFHPHKGAAANGYVSIYTPEGEHVHTTMLGGDRVSTRSYVQGIVPCDDGGYIVGGCFLDGENPMPNGDFLEFAKDKSKTFGKTDTFFAKYNENNELVWMDTFSGSDHDQLKSMVADKDGYLAIVETFSNDGDMKGQHYGLADLAIVKYSYDGEKQWQTVVGGKNIESTRTGLDILANGNYILGGHASSKIGDFEGQQAYGDLFDLFAAEIDREGNIKWVKNYGGNKNDYCYTVTATEDGGFIMGGNTKSTTDSFENIGTFYDNAYVMKLDANGNKEWADVIKSSGASEVTSIMEQNNGYVVLGETRGRDFDFKDKNKGSMDTFLANYDAEGNRLSLETIGGSKEDYPATMLELNDYQNAVLLHSISTDGDMKDINRGEYDGAVLVYNYGEQSLTPNNPDNPDNPVNPNDPNSPNDPSIPDSEGTIDPNPSNPDQHNGNIVKPDSNDNGDANDVKDGTDVENENPNTGDNSNMLIWLNLIVATIAIYVVAKKKLSKFSK